MIKRFRAKPLPPKIILAIFALVLLGFGFWIYKITRNEEPDVQNFDACVAAGNPVRETFPEQCSHKGKTFFKPGQEPPPPY
jgi:hypothetical protein